MTYVIYDDDGFNSKSGRLTYEAIESFMIKPTIDLMLSSILDDKNCDEAQSAINTAFLEHQETLMSNYVASYDYDLSPDTSDYECDCEGFCERQCLVNAVVSYNFKEIIRQFEAGIDDDDEELSYFTDEYTEEDFMRIREVAYDVTRILLYRELGRWAFYHGAYETGISYNSVATLVYGCAIRNKKQDFASYIKDEISDRNRKASDARWQPHREKKKERKEKYLKIMKDKGFSTYTDAATYIKLHIDTGKSPSFNTVFSLLSEADKGNFS